jgi:hypothetical protein
MLTVIIVLGGAFALALMFVVAGGIKGGKALEVGHSYRALLDVVDENREVVSSLRDVMRRELKRRQAEVFLLDDERLDREWSDVNYKVTISDPGDSTAVWKRDAELTVRDWLGKDVVCAHVISFNGDYPDWSELATKLCDCVIVEFIGSGQPIVKPNIQLSA